MFKTTIGAELELYLIDKEGYIKNNAPEILNDSRIKDAGCFYQEGTNAQIEVNSNPINSIYELDKDLKGKSKLLDDICREYSSFPIPTSEYGAGKGEVIDHPLIDLYDNILGETARKNLYYHSGIHLHVSQIPKKELKQFWLLQALDPLTYALTSTSSISFNGKNGINCHRINNQRNIVFKDFPLHGQLQNYPLSLDELNERDNKRWEQWLKIAKDKGISQKLYEANYKRDKTGYHPIRKRDGIGPNGTFEVRSFDTAPLDILFASLAFVKGIHDYVMNKDIDLEISDKLNKYSFSREKIILPNIETLRNMESETINNGLKSDLVYDYLSHLLPFAEKGLPREDKKYLDPIKMMLETIMNPADYVMYFMKISGHTGSQFSPEQSAQANLFMRRWYENTLNYR